MNHMTTRTSSRPGQSCLINLLALAGMLLIIAGAIVAYPVLRDALTPPPAAFGEVQTPLRPTVTPLPGAVIWRFRPHQLLPETPVSRPVSRHFPSLLNCRDRSVSRGADPIVIPAINPTRPRAGGGAVNGVSTWILIICCLIEVYRTLSGLCMKSGARTARSRSTSRNSLEECGVDSADSRRALDAGHLLAVRQQYPSPDRRRHADRPKLKPWASSNRASPHGPAYPLLIAPRTKIAYNRP
jgi:hypothetical protein